MTSVVPIITSSESTADTSDHVTETPIVPKVNVIRGHADYCHCVCLSCLEKTKTVSSRPFITKNGTNSLVEEFVKICPDFFEIIDYLPKMICDCCRKKLENKSAVLLVDYKSLVQNVKAAQLEPSTSKNIKCSCEICRIATTTINPKKSSFLIQTKCKPGRPSLEPDQNMDFSGLTKTEKVNQFMRNFSPDTRDPMLVAHYEQRVRESEASAKDVTFKRLHGHPAKIPKPGTNKPKKVVIEKGTLIKIKKEVYESGRSIVKIAQILSDDNPELKIEKYFKEHVVNASKPMKKFFSVQNVDMQIYEKIDLQLWKVSESGAMINKSGHVHFQENIVVLPDVGRLGCIEDANSGKVFTLNKDNNEVTLNSKTILKSKSISTRSSDLDPRTATINKTSDAQSWIMGHADNQGWFYIKHKKSGQYLTSNKTRNKTSLTVEELLDDSKKRQPFDQKKDYTYVNDIDAFITHVAHHREYPEDQELKVEIGLDSGKGSCKLFMSIEKKQRTPTPLGAGHFSPPPKKKKKGGKYMTKHLDRGVKKLFVIGLVRGIAETYQNVKKILELPGNGIQKFGFIFDFKMSRICLGMQSCSATYPCSYCLGTSPFDPFGEQAELRTFASIKEDAEKFKAMEVRIGPEAAKKLAKECHSVVEFSLITGDFPQQKILFKILIDELHVFLGVGNHIFDSMYEKMINDMKNDIFHGSVYHWAEKKNICGAKYNGGQLGAEFVILFIFSSLALKSS